MLPTYQNKFFVLLTPYLKIFSILVSIYFLQRFKINSENVVKRDNFCLLRIVAQKNYLKKCFVQYKHQ